MALLIGLLLSILILFMLSSAVLPFIIGAIATVFFTLTILGAAAAVMALSAIAFGKYMSGDAELTLQTQSAQHRNTPFGQSTRINTSNRSKDELIDELKSQFKKGELTLTEYEELLETVLDEKSQSTQTRSYETQTR